MKTELQRLQEFELDILKQTAKICEKNGLTYFVGYGTLLGAVRHKGFIPWDDDIDIVMPRPDYDRFLEIAEKQLSAPYQLHTATNGKGSYGYYYARVENTAVRLQKSATANKTVIPAWIDVFPLDGIPDDERELCGWMKKCASRKKVFAASNAHYTAAADEFKKSRSSLKSKMRGAFLKLRLDRLISTKRAWKRLDKAVTEYDYDSSNRIMNAMCFYGRSKEVFSKEAFGKGTPLPFEDFTVNAPEKYDFVLTQIYGDYMTPPEEGKRDRHHIRIIEMPE